MSQILFNLNNPQVSPPQPYLYIGQQNSLNIQLYTAEGTETLYKNDTLTFLFPSGFLSTASLGFVAPGWEMSYSSSNGKDIYTLTLVGQDSLQITTRPYIITLTGLSVQSVTHADVYMDYTANRRRESGPPAQKVFSLNPPNQAQDLLDVITFTVRVNEDQSVVDPDLVYLSDPLLQPPIANRIHLNLKFSGEQLLPKGYTGNPRFQIYFSYSPPPNSNGLTNSDALTHSDALTNAINTDQPGYNALTSAWSITAKTDETTLWNCEGPNELLDTPIWTATPNTTNNPYLFADQAPGSPNLDLHFDHVISIMPPGNATLYIQWSEIWYALGKGGYNDGVIALNLTKVLPSPQVLLSSPDDGTTIPSGQAVLLHWQAFAAQTLELTWDNGNRQDTIVPYNSDDPSLYYEDKHSLSVVPDSSNAKFLLKATGFGQNVVSNEVTVSISNFPAPQIQEFDAVLQKDNAGNLQIVLTWLVTNLGNNGYFLLNNTRIDGKQYNGFPYTETIPLSSAVFSGSFTLIAVDQTLNLSSSISKEVQLPNWFEPNILSFEAQVVRDNQGNPSMAFSWQLDSVVDECTCSIVGISDGDLQGIGADGKGGLSNVALSTARPMKSSYTLQVKNPNGTIASKTLSVNFEKKDAINQQPPGTNAEYTGSQLLMSPDGKNCFVVFANDPYVTGISFSDFYMAQFDPNQYNTLQFSDSYSLIKPFDYNLRLSLSGDGQQVFINDSYTLCCILFQGRNFNETPLSPLYIFILAESNTLSSAFMPDDSWVFAAKNDKIIYFVPNPDDYAQGLFDPQPHTSLMNIGSSEGALLSAIAITPDGKRVFVADKALGRVYWFDTTNIPAELSNYIDNCYQATDLAIADNGWLYILGATENDPYNSLRVHALNTNVDDYQNHPSDQYGNFDHDFGVNQIQVSRDNSFVLVVTNNLYIWLGADEQNPKVRGLQTIGSFGSMFCAVAITPDNTRIFVADEDTINVLEPVFG